jgi:hypothetical protein
MDRNSNEKQKHINKHKPQKHDTISSNEDIIDESQQEFSQNNRKLSDSNNSNENEFDENSHSQKEIKNSSKISYSLHSCSAYGSLIENYQEHIPKIKKLTCISCAGENAKQNLLQCYICNVLKCKECTAKETHNSMKKRDNAAYICENCYLNKNR